MKPKKTKGISRHYRFHAPPAKGLIAIAGVSVPAAF
jgi:hypothetical protein